MENIAEAGIFIAESVVVVAFDTLYTLRKDNSYSSFVLFVRSIMTAIAGYSAIQIYCDKFWSIERCLMILDVLEVHSSKKMSITTFDN